jgi:hypothetical protein
VSSNHRPPSDTWAPRPADCSVPTKHFWASYARSTATSARLSAMAFGQQSGPPASARLIQELLALLRDAGHVDFRDARGPMGFTQRQAAGKFTREEATAFIDRLEDAQFDAEAVPVLTSPVVRLSAREQAIRRVADDELADELRRRGWTVVAP